jgi:hypothetical protein
LLFSSFFRYLLRNFRGDEITGLRSVVTEEHKQFQATIAEQQKEFEARLKQQDVEIQRVNNRIELSVSAIIDSRAQRNKRIVVGI